MKRAAPAERHECKALGIEAALDTDKTDRARHAAVCDPQDRFGGFPVIDFGKQSAPRANHRFEDNRIAHFLDGFDSGIDGKGCPGF